MNIFFYSFLLASGIVEIARYFHPATFSIYTFPALIAAAFLCALWSIIKKSHE